MDVEICFIEGAVLCQNSFEIRHSYNECEIAHSPVISKSSKKYIAPYLASMISKLGSFMSSVFSFAKLLDSIVSVCRSGRCNVSAGSAANESLLNVSSFNPVSSMFERRGKDTVQSQ